MATMVFPRYRFQLSNYSEADFTALQAARKEQIHRFPAENASSFAKSAIAAGDGASLAWRG
jgi:hypothetical protein